MKQRRYRPKEVMHMLMEEHEFMDVFDSVKYERYEKCISCGFKRSKPQTNPTNEQSSALFIKESIDADKALESLNIPGYDPTLT